ncbi:MAG: EamA family transporter [Opitutaceae bacterium]|nr:EamA family transporter [Opitutaceae bacterium]
MLLLATVFWGLSFPLIKTLTLLHARMFPDAGTWFHSIYAIAPRFPLAIAILIAWRPAGFWRISRLEWKQGGVIALFATAGMLLQNDGLQFTAASTSAFLTQFYAILIPIWTAVHLRRNPGARVWWCCVLVLAGVAILGRFDPLVALRAGSQLHFGRGEWETLLSSLFFMGQILWLEKKEFAANRPEKITLVLFGVQGTLLWLLAFATAPEPGALLVPWMSVPWLGLTLLLTVFCTVGAFLLMNTFQPKITATEAGLLYCIEPIFASIMAAFLPAWFSVWTGVDYPNEEATWTLLVGGALITVANVIVQLKPLPKE